MQCHEFIEYSGEWLEGGRAVAAVAHVNGCPRCRGLVADLEAITQTAGELDAETPAPPERVWLALRAQLQEEGILRERQAVAASFADFFSVFSRPALASAYVAVLLAALVLGGFSLTQYGGEPLQQFPAPEKMLQPQFARAEQREMVSLHHHDPDVVATYRDNLEIVDKFIAACEKTVREEPSNRMAREYLYAAYQQKADLLATMTEVGTGGDE